MARISRRRPVLPDSSDLAAQDPIARVLPMATVAHLDRDFDYAVPAEMADRAVPGARVKIRFAGRDLDGYILQRRAETDHTGTLTPLKRVVSPEPVLCHDVAAAITALALRYAGTRGDLVRLAVPPRHARTETAEPQPRTPPRNVDASAAHRWWDSYPTGEAYLNHLETGGNPRAVWTAAPGDQWEVGAAHLAAACLASGRGSIWVVPDQTDVERLKDSMTAVLGPDTWVDLSAAAGPATRYRNFLSVLRGQTKVVLGTRSAAFAPVKDLGLVSIWDDGDESHAELRAPYPHAREVLLTRAQQSGCAALLGSYARSVEAEYLVRTGWAQELTVARETLRQRVRVSVAGASDQQLQRDPFARSARIPSEAHAAIKRGLEFGPVLIQTPRSGYLPGLACERCGTSARCSVCEGPLQQAAATSAPACGWCAREASQWACPECFGRGLKAPRIGHDRTAEELGRAFPKVPVVQSGGNTIITSVKDRPALVVATPGAEPLPEGPGYTAVMVLDTWLMLGRPDHRAGEEALRRWSNAVGRARPGAEAVVVGRPDHPAVQSLVRLDYRGYAQREIDDRTEAHLPPGTRMAAISGDQGAVADALTLADFPEPVEILGPVPTASGEERILVRVPRANSAALSASLRQLQWLRSSRKLEPVRVQVDPQQLLD